MVSIKKNLKFNSRTKQEPINGPFVEGPVIAPEVIIEGRVADGTLYPLVRVATPNGSAGKADNLSGETIRSAIGEPWCGVEIVVSERIGTLIWFGFAGDNIQRLSSPPML